MICWVVRHSVGILLHMVISPKQKQRGTQPCCPWHNRAPVLAVLTAWTHHSLIRAISTSLFKVPKPSRFCNSALSPAFPAGSTRIQAVRDWSLSIFLVWFRTSPRPRARDPSWHWELHCSITGTVGEVISITWVILSKQLPRYLISFSERMLSCLAWPLFILCLHSSP